MKIKFLDNQRLIVLIPTIIIDLFNGVELALTWLNWHVVVEFKSKINK